MMIEAATRGDDGEQSVAGGFQPSLNEAWPMDRLAKTWGLLCSLHEPGIGATAGQLARLALQGTPAVADEEADAEGGAPRSAIASVRAALAWVHAQGDDLARGDGDRGGGYPQRLLAAAAACGVVSVGAEAPLIAHGWVRDVLVSTARTLEIFALPPDQAVLALASSRDACAAAARAGAVAPTVERASEFWAHVVEISQWHHADARDLDDSSQDSDVGPEVTDVDAPEFAHRLARGKDNFTDRRAFNIWVCDQIARLGSLPNPATVLRLGRWGNAQAVADDVKAWILQVGDLSRRLAETRVERLRLPQPLRARALGLLDEMWSLAKANADQDVLRQAGLSAVQIRHVVEFYERRVAKMSLEREAAVQDLQASRDAGAALQSRADDLAAEIEAQNHALVAVRDQLRLNQALVQQLNADKQAASAAHARELAARAATHEVEVAGLKQSIALLEGQFDALRRESAVNVDRARQDAKAAQQRESAERSRADTLIADLALAQRDLQVARDEQAGQKARLEALLRGQDQLAQEVASKAARLVEAIKSKDAERPAGSEPGGHVELDAAAMDILNLCERIKSAV